MDQAEKLSVTITTAQAKKIREMVRSGAYASTSEVVRAGLRSLEREEAEYRERLESIRGRVSAAIEDARAPISGEEVRARLQKRFERALKDETDRLRDSGAA